MFTPDITAGVLPGIIREWVIEKTKEFKISYKEGHFDMANLYHADELFITNSVLGIMHVRIIENQLINNGEAGEITSLLKKELFAIR